MAHLDMTGYRHAPQNCTSVEEVMANAARVRAARKKGWALPIKPALPLPVEVISGAPDWALIGKALPSGNFWIPQEEPIPEEPEEPPYSPPTIQRIQRAVCRHFNVTSNEIFSQRRTAAIVFPRQLGMALCKHLTRRSLPEIGRKYDGRDHTTVLHAVRKYAPAIESAAAEIDFGVPVAVWVDRAAKHSRVLQLHLQKAKRVDSPLMDRQYGTASK